MFVFLENLVCFVFLEHSFSDSPFCLITDDFAEPFENPESISYIC